MPYRNPDERKKYQEGYDADRKLTHKAVKVTMTLKGYGKFEAFAKSSGQSVASVILYLAEAKLKDVCVLAPATSQKLDDVVRLLRSCGNNVNQIAHACNLQAGYTDDPPSSEEGVEILSRIHDGLANIEILVSDKFNEK